MGRWEGFYMTRSMILGIMKFKLLNDDLPDMITQTLIGNRYLVDNFKWGNKTEPLLTKWVMSV